MILALLSAQLGAQAHAYSHLSHAADPASTSSAHGGACLDCLSFAPLLASAAGSGHAAWFAPQCRQLAPESECTSQRQGIHRLAFRSRAPPLASLRP